MLQFCIPIRPTSCYRLEHCVVCSPSCSSHGFATLLCSQVQAPSRHNTRPDPSVVCSCFGLAWWNTHIPIVNCGVNRMTVVGSVELQKVRVFLAQAWFVSSLESWYPELKNVAVTCVNTSIIACIFVIPHSQPTEYCPCPNTYMAMNPHTYSARAPHV